MCLFRNYDNLEIKYGGMGKLVFCGGIWNVVSVVFTRKLFGVREGKGYVYEVGCVGN